VINLRHTNGTSPRVERIQNVLAAISPEAAGGNDMFIALRVQYITLV
jgi:hypothetical protein